MNHFVVLERVGARSIVVVDPAVGRRKITSSELSKSFSGVALELTPSLEFKPSDERQKVRIGSLIGSVTGLYRALTTVFIFALLLEMIALLSPLLNQWMVDDALAALDADLVTSLVFGFGLLLVLQTMIGLARSWTMIYLSTHLNLQWSANIFLHLLNLPETWFQHRSLGDIASRFSALGAIQGTLTSGVIGAILDGIMAIATIYMMFVYSVQLAIVVSCAVLMYALLRALSYSPFRQAGYEGLILSAREQSYFLESIRAAQAIRLFNYQKARQSRWTNLRVDVLNRALRTQRFATLFGLANTAIFGVQNLLVFWIGARQIMSSNGAFTVGMLLAFQGYAGQFTGRLSACIDRAIDMFMLSLHSERLGDIVLTERVDLKQLSGSTPSLPHYQIELVDAGFRYGPDEPWVFRQLNVTITPGEHVAITGTSGCGKSTLAKVILGLLELSEGRLIIGGRDVTQVPLQIDGIVGTVMQEDMLLSGSLLDNISFFDDQVSMERVERAASLAQISDDIEALPMKYLTLVGEAGGTLSGGQKQRILLARALYREPKVLILDEATSHLDTGNEARVNAAISQLCITRISIAHRLETINSADRVIRLPIEDVSLPDK